MLSLHGCQVTDVLRLVHQQDCNSPGGWRDSMRTLAARRIARRSGSSGELDGPARAPSSGPTGSYRPEGVLRAPAFITCSTMLDHMIRDKGAVVYRSTASCAFAFLMSTPSAAMGYCSVVTHKLAGWWQQTAFTHLCAVAGRHGAVSQPVPDVVS
jgi:hypothetical protein